MKNIFLILIVVSQVCLGQKTVDKRFKIEIVPTDSILIQNPYKDKTKRDSIARKYENWHERSRALEKYLLKIENPGITRGADDLIEITLLNGKKIKLVPDSNIDEGDFTFERHYKKLGLLLFRVQWGEGNNYAVINTSTGKKTYVIGQIFFSPDNKFAIAINCDLLAQYSGNGFQLFELVKGDLKEIWEYDPKVWGPIELKWTDNQTIISRNDKIDAGGKIVNAYTKIKIARKNSR